jgi:anti-sigma B factor antagonist
MALQILTDATGAAAVRVSLEGRLDALTAPELEQFAATLDSGVKTLILDLSRLTFISSAGLRTFAKLRRTMLTRDGNCCFINPTPPVQKVFDIVKAIPHTAVFRNTDELDDYLALMQQRVIEEQTAHRA